MERGDQIGQYRLEELIAEGGMGSVWRANHPNLERQVAIKFVKAEVSGNPHAREAFMREVRHLSGLHGPQIVQIQDFGFTGGGDPYMVTEFLEGEDLLARLKSKGPISVRDALYIGIEVLKALGEAHAIGLVHRDLKPGNIFLQSLAGGARTAVKVLDFGVAKLLQTDEIESTLWPEGTPKGSPRYMSPEQILDNPVTPATDFYAFGATVYRSLCGEPVFGGSLVVMMQAHLDASPMALRDRFPQLGIPAKLDALLLRCLAKDPKERPESVDVLQAAFEYLLQTLGTERPSPSAEPAPGVALPGMGPPSQPPKARSAVSDETVGTPSPIQGLGSLSSQLFGSFLPPKSETGPDEVSEMADGRVQIGLPKSVDPHESTVQALSPNAILRAGNGGAAGRVRAEGNAPAFAESAPLPRKSAPGTPSPSVDVQSARRPKAKRFPLELLLALLVLAGGAAYYLSAQDGGEAVTAELATDSDLTKDEADAARRNIAHLSLDATPAAPVVVAKDAGRPVRDAKVPTVTVRVVPGPALFRAVKTRAVICKNAHTCLLPINIDFRVEKRGYRSKVLTGDDLYDRSNGTWRVVLRKR